MTRPTQAVPVDPLDTLHVLCERLKLPEVSRLAAAEQWTYSQYLIDVFQAEVAARQARYVVSHTQMSHLPFHKTLDQYDFTFQPSLDERQVRQLLTLQWVDAAENLIVLGPPGVGKTHLVVAMAAQAIVERISVYFITIQDLVADLRKAWDENRFATRLGLYVRPRLLCIDEVGYLPLSPLEANLFFRLVAARYERGSLALTSNKGFVDWGQVFGDPVLATAILDRLVTIPPFSTSGETPTVCEKNGKLDCWVRRPPGRPRHLLLANLHRAYRTTPSLWHQVAQDFPSIVVDWTAVAHQLMEWAMNPQYGDPQEPTVLRQAADILTGWQSSRPS